MHAFWLVLTYDLLEDRRIDDVIIKTFLNSLLYKTNRFQVAVCLFSDTLSCALCATFLFLPHFNVICDILLNRRTATWNLFVKSTTIFVLTVVKFVADPLGCASLNHCRFVFTTILTSNKTTLSVRDQNRDALTREALSVLLIGQSDCDVTANCGTSNWRHVCLWPYPPPYFRFTLTGRVRLHVG